MAMDLLSGEEYEEVTRGTARHASDCDAMSNTDAPTEREQNWTDPTADAQSNLKLMIDKRRAALDNQNKSANAD